MRQDLEEAGIEFACTVGAVKGLGEVNLWVKDLEKMTVFYEKAMGLNRSSRTSGTSS